jgi:hypothetical protein
MKMMTRDDVQSELGWTENMIYSLLPIPDSPHGRRCTDIGAYTHGLYYRDRVLAVAQSTEGRAGLTCCGEGYNLRSMPRVGQFCPSNIARLLLVVFIIVTLLIAIGFWLYHSPGHGTSIEHSPASDK